MRNPKVVKHKETGFKAFFKNRRNWLAVSLVLLILLLFSAAMPMANIPGFGRLGALLGLTPDSMRYLTLSDLMAYAVGVDGNKVSIAQAQFYSAYDGGGGLSPFSIISKNRLLNAREAYLREYEATGIRPNMIDGPLSKAQYPGANVNYEGVTMIPPGGAVPALDAARGDGSEYGEGFGAPIGKLGQGFDGLGAGSSAGLGSLAGKGSSSGARMTLPVKPSGAGSIAGVSKGESSFKKGLEGSVNKLQGGRLGSMGGLNAMASKVQTRVGAMGQMGAFDTMGRAFFFSYNAKVAGYKTAAKTLAEAAFDGEEPPAESLITPGEQQEVILDTLEPPNTVIDKANQGINACSAAKKAYKDAIKEQYEAVKNIFQGLKDVGKAAPNNIGVPGTCSGIMGKKKKTKQVRKSWNSYVDGLKGSNLCAELKKMEDSYAKACGMQYNPSPKGGCSDSKLDKLYLKGDTWISGVIGSSCIHNPKSRLDGSRVTHATVDQIMTEMLKSDVPGVDPGNF